MDKDTIVSIAVPAVREDSPLHEVNLRDRPCTYPRIGAHAHPTPGRDQPCFIQRDRDRRGDYDYAAGVFASARCLMIA